MLRDCLLRPLLFAGFLAASYDSAAALSAKVKVLSYEEPVPVLCGSRSRQDLPSRCHGPVCRTAA
jgi:hypothetical protein